MISRSSIVACLALFLAFPSRSIGEEHAPPKRAPAQLGASPEGVQAISPPFSEGIFPCSDCHDEEEPPNTKRRKLKNHFEQQSVFAHDAEHRWCLDCHDAAKRDFLHLSDGERIPFTESYRLCGQCHGDKYRDWRAGIHGKRIGMWDGPKTYYLCVNCHNPHTPRFQGLKEVQTPSGKLVAPTLDLIKPEPRPLRPEEMRR